MHIILLGISMKWYCALLYKKGRKYVIEVSDECIKSAMGRERVEAGYKHIMIKRWLEDREFKFAREVKYILDAEEWEEPEEVSFIWIKEYKTKKEAEKEFKELNKLIEEYARKTL